jgi:hypothetical protein
MQMMMHMLLPLRRLLRLRFKLFLLTRALEPSSISLRFSFCGAIIVVDAAVLSILGVIVLLGQDFRVFEGLDCGMVVVLMFFFLNEGLFAGFVLLFDVGVLDGRRDVRVDSCVYIAVGGGGCGGIGWAIGGLLALWLVGSRVLSEEFVDCIHGVIHSVDLSDEKMLNLWLGTFILWIV